MLADKPDITRPIASAARRPSIRCTKRVVFAATRDQDRGRNGRARSALMAVRASGHIPYGEWVRFVMPLIATWFVICIGALIVGIWIDWGPS